jgi:type 1 glutamine amidotransferase
MVATALNLSAADKKIILVAGGVSHGRGDHEHRAGCLLFKACLDQLPGIKCEVHTNGWVQDPKAFEGADAIVVYSDGGGGHPFLQEDHLQVLSALMKKGVGLGCVHYAVEVPKEKGGQEWLDWTGGYFETFWSVNPFWEAEFKKFPDHPVARGLKPFKQNDEWYYHMRFQPEMKGVTPILTAVPPDKTRGRDGMNDAHGGNPEVQKHKGEPEHVMWVYDRPDGARGFGFTGGHSHKFWANDSFRIAVLNAIVWIAKAEVPANGVDVPVPPGFLTGNMDKK